MSFFKKNFFLTFFNNLLIDHPTPVNISYWWNFGSLAALCLFLQIFSGIFLAMFYIPNIDLAFLSIEHIMRDVNLGWFFRYLHMNTASFFFLVVYIHIFRAIYYRSYRGKNFETWLIGVTIYILMMATAFLGYVLPWGQMSLWGATVITNFFSVIPFFGEKIVVWLWGGFSVGNATLNRFFSLHFFLPFLILACVLLHLIALHHSAHTNPIGVMPTFKYSSGDFVSTVTFFPFFIFKDLFGILLFLFFLFFFLFFSPNFFGHPDNYIPANPLVTPSHIVPEWYFLPFYAILRSIPNKTFGVIAMFSSILVFYFLPKFDKSEGPHYSFQPLSRIFFWIFLINCLVLGWIGGNPVEPPYYYVGQFATFFYFFYLLFLLQFLVKIDDILNEIVIEVTDQFFVGNIRFKEFSKKNGIFTCKLIN